MVAVVFRTGDGLNHESQVSNIMTVMLWVRNRRQLHDRRLSYRASGGFGTHYAMGWTKSPETTGRSGPTLIP